MHAVDQPGIFQGVPHDLVLGLNWVVAHGVHGADEGNPAALGGDAIDFFGGILGALHGNEGREEEPFRVFLGELKSPFVVGLAHGPGPQGVLQPRVSVDAGGYDHHLVYTLDVHVPQPRPGFLGSGVGQVIRLLPGQRGLRVEVADVEGALNVVFEPGTGQPYDVDGPGAGLRYR